MKKLFNSFTGLPHPSRKTVLLVLIVATITILLSALISTWISGITNLKVPSIGTIRTLGVDAYGGDINTTQNGQKFIDWGIIYPGTATNRSFYIRNKSNIEITLNLTKANLTYIDSNGKNVTSPDQSYLNLTWNYNDTPLSPNEVIYVTLTLHASPDQSFIDYLITNNVREFSFDIYICPSEEH